MRWRPLGKVREGSITWRKRGREIWVGRRMEAWNGVKEMQMLSEREA